jgi:hypothetical protein
MIPIAWDGSLARRPSRHQRTAEKPALSDEERAERLRRLAERMFSQDGLDRDTLEHIEQLTGNES